MVIKGFRFTVLVKSVVIIRIVNPQYIFIAGVVNINC